MSERTLQDNAYETAKKYIGQRIEGTRIETVEFLGKIDEDRVAEEDGDQFQTVFTMCDVESNIGAWIHEIDEDAKESVLSSDEGDRDNILENKEFAKLFIRLCKYSF